MARRIRKSSWVGKKKPGWYAGVTDPVSGIRAYWGPYPTKEQAQRKLRTKQGIRKAVKKIR